MCGFYLAGCDQARRGRARSRPDVEHKCRRRDIPSQGHSVAGNGVRARRSPAIMPLSTRKTTMLTLYDYLPSQNAWKVRQLRSEEHTSELQSLMRISYAVFCLKKKNHQRPDTNTPPH